MRDRRSIYDFLSYCTPEEPHLRNNRKLRLLTCAFCRLRFDLSDHRFANAISVAERCADSEASSEELEAVNAAMSDLCAFYNGSNPFVTRHEERENFDTCYYLVRATMRYAIQPAGELIMGAEPSDLRYLLSEIYANLFRPITLSPEWRTDAAVTLTRQMYESHDFSAMPILADALQDAGCDDEDVLSHCRDTAQVHVRGC
jgi:hypothetical protein